MVFVAITCFLFLHNVGDQCRKRGAQTDQYHLDSKCGQQVIRFYSNPEEPDANDKSCNDERRQR